MERQAAGLYLESIVALTPEDVEHNIEQLYGELRFASALLSRMLSALGKERAGILVDEVAGSLRFEHSGQRLGAVRFKERVLHDLSNQRSN